MIFESPNRFSASLHFYTQNFKSSCSLFWYSLEIECQNIAHIYTNLDKKHFHLHIQICE